MNKKISLAGDLGSGKTTIGDILTKEYNLKKVSVGEFLREMATEHGMDVLTFNTYMESHPEFDKILDDRLKSYEHKDGDFLFDSRLAWHFVPSSFKVYMTVDPVTAAKRIMGANRATESYENVEEAAKKIKERRKSENQRYENLYGVEIQNMQNYDLVVDTNGRTPEEVASVIIDGFEKWLNTKR
ncbi:MAG: cytidylate kinase family protein [Clostridia bacterium]|nr:cytidylate kinase family protein [Clostridia bacterium]